MTPRTPPRPPGAPEPYGAFATVDSFGGGAAPLLAGFAVTLLALIIQISAALRWPDLALVLFGLAATMFLHVVQLTARAKGYAVTPAQVREWYDDYADPDRQRAVAWELTHHRECWLFLVGRARVFYDCAMLALLVGVAVLLVPRHTRELTPLRWAAIAVAGLAVLAEILEMVDQVLKGRGSRRGPLASLARITGWLAPSDPPVPRRPFR
ncbi:hypothetical protein GCM10023322_63120 [Rugosimonospora acidiphila]|uniref:Integral membrane protein n=1 Tax=Rugosimonospora acidiphila TaxID=556531 RepID=A0ABP9SJJ3_9ACTN